MTNTRLAAAKVLQQVLDNGRSLATLLPQAFDRIPQMERAFAQELVYGSLRWHVRLAALLDELLATPLKPRDHDILCLLLLGLYQLSRLGVAPHAAVNETVNAARLVRKPWAVGLINGVLRSYQRQRQRLENKLDNCTESRLAHPQWFLAQLKQDWPDDWEAIALANNERAPMALRVNLRRQSRTVYLDKLREAHLPAHEAPFTRAGICLETPIAVARLPGFEDGDASVQDVAAQLAAELLDVQPGMRILDACAAPGGKTAHILECGNNRATVVAIDRDMSRLMRVAENLERLGLNAELIRADAGEPDRWWDKVQFDRILLDAPCSASGVIRRHPDIKLLRRAADLEQLAQQQERFLERLWPLLASGGMLLYATCSVFRLENEERVVGFLARHDDAFEATLTADWGRAMQNGRQILPGENGMDGFYYACLIKR
jgi:16S rRNA (cytosine967-C5)-methyltransferase